MRKDWRLLLFNWRMRPEIQRMFVEEMKAVLPLDSLYSILRDVVRYGKMKAGRPPDIASLLSCAGIYASHELSALGESDSDPSPAPLAGWFQQRRPGEVWYRRQLLRSLGEELAYLHGCGFLHGDLRCEHVNATPGARPRLYFTGLGGTIFRGRQPGVRRRLKELAVFNRRVGRLLSRTERLRVFRAYLGAIGLETNWKRQAAYVENLSRTLEIRPS